MRKKDGYKTAIFKLFIGTISFLMTVSVASVVFGNDYPKRPIAFTVGSSPGGGPGGLPPADPTAVSAL